MANSHKLPTYGAVPYRSREGLSTRAVSNSDEIQLRIDPMNADLDDEITGLRTKITQLKTVAQEIGSEAKFQNDFITQLIPNTNSQPSQKDEGITAKQVILRQITLKSLE
ncbi:hypothetical protein BVC80_5g49 [Macleaya cordata]|uniref:Target SNARE coiled-coil domain n=1 Tax=Macleaya cordata TaxID=56857 RepID=A0A200QXQ9_MACCD|nr:hypothetical protein BVC80_5g49 [Macleaya cordata]